MNAVEGTEFVDESTAKKWFMRFNNGDTSLKPRPRNVCDAVWFDVFGFLGNAKLGIYMEVISCHKWVFHWHNFTSLHFQRAKNGTGAELFTFNKLSIGFIDRTVIAFLHSIKHAFCPRFYFTVNIGIEQKQSWAIVMEQIWPLVPMSECYFRPTNGFPASLLDCAELRLISSDFNFPMAFLCVSNGADQSDEKAATWHCSIGFMCHARTASRRRCSNGPTAMSTKASSILSRNLSTTHRQPLTLS
ncbi:hypothetical protein niasHT_035924 [Heterodera trifolii]|uniref:Transposase n=1 Tax=Heterodera trifolii TaxID=157864 RepID=A0ABD2IGW1_9BILA